MPEPESSLVARLTKIKETLSRVRHMALATVNEDGSPHNSVVFLAHDEAAQFYWCSSPEAQHSQNILRTGQVFIVLFDSIEKGGGLFVQAKAHEVNGEELQVALPTFNSARERLLREKYTLDQVSGSAPQRLYCASPIAFSVNMAKKDAAGMILRDTRYPISLAQARSVLY